MPRLRRWAVTNGKGTVVSTHLTYTGAFWEARGRSLSSEPPSRWWVTRLGGAR